jgi:hypothetical protein
VEGSWEQKDVDGAITAIMKISGNQSDKLSGRLDCATKLLTLLHNWKAGHSITLSDHINITKAIQTLYDNAFFFKSLKKNMTKFNGTLHCEACLASLLPGPQLNHLGKWNMIGSKYDDTLAQMKVRCCFRLVLYFLSSDPHDFV